MGTGWHGLYRGHGETDVGIHWVWFGVVKKGIIWGVGFGSKIQIWRDPWIPQAPSWKIESEERVFMHKMGVPTNSVGPTRMGHTNGECLPLPLWCWGSPIVKVVGDKCWWSHCLREVWHIFSEKCIQASARTRASWIVAWRHWYAGRWKSGVV
jgi:hypothetical protein